MEICNRDISPTPWSKVFNGPCGRFRIFYLLLSLALFVAMMTYVGIYTGSVLAHPNTICAPYSFIFWRIVIPIVLIFWFLLTLYANRFCCGIGATLKVCQVFSSQSIFFLCFVAICCLLEYAPLYSINGLIIKEENSSDVMLQLLVKHGENSTIYLGVYPIFFRHDDVNDMFNSSCEFVPFSELCPVFGPLQSINLPGAFRCHPNIGQDLEPFVSYQKPHLESARTTMNISIAFIFLFTFGCISLMDRRWTDPDEWIENQCCRSSGGEADESTRLI